MCIRDSVRVERDYHRRRLPDTITHARNEAAREHHRIHEAGGLAPGARPRGTSISCKGWQQEAALRMLMNNLDPEVAEAPDELVVYGGAGKAARCLLYTSPSPRD